MRKTLPVVAVLLLAGAARAEVKLVPDETAPRVFGAGTRTVSVVWTNTGDKPVDVELRPGLFQAGSATTVRLGRLPVKKIQMLPRQTILDSVALDFPAVKAETRFLVQWAEGTNTIAGTKEVFAYPTNLLEQLKPLAGDDGPGVFDPQNQIKPLLRNARMDFIDLEERVLEDFRGRLAIVGPVESPSELNALRASVETMARKGAVVVWIQPPPEKYAKLQPSFYSVPEGSNTVIVVQPELVARLADNPQAQLNLIYFCKLALQPEPWPLPGRGAAR